MSLLNLQKQIQAEKRKDFEKRVDPFLKEYNELRKKYGCQWDARLQMLPDSKGIIPSLTIVDVKEQVNKESKAGEETKKVE